MIINIHLATRFLVIPSKCQHHDSPYYLAVLIWDKRQDATYRSGEAREGRERGAEKPKGPRKYRQKGEMFPEPSFLTKPSQAKDPLLKKCLS